jgi:hypothetical protein
VFNAGIQAQPLCWWGSFLMNPNDHDPDRMRQKLEAFEDRLSHQENKTYRVMILATGLAASATLLVLVHILAS